MCLACHDPNRVVQGKSTPSQGGPAASTRPQPTKFHRSPRRFVQHRCTECLQFVPHGPRCQLAGPTAAPATPPAPGVDAATQDCMTCHNGGTYVSPAAPNIMAEMAKTGHPLPSGNNNPRRRRARRAHQQPPCYLRGLPQRPRFQPGNSFRSAAHNARSQAGVQGVSALDGVTVLTPAVNQYENCLRCHGTGAGKQRLTDVWLLTNARLVPARSLNVIHEFSCHRDSSHPVTHDRSSPLPQPSLRPTC